jgi:hypothetical protein
MVAHPDSNRRRRGARSLGRTQAVYNDSRVPASNGLRAMRYDPRMHPHLMHPHLSVRHLGRLLGLVILVVAFPAWLGYKHWLRTTTEAREREERDRV